LDNINEVGTYEVDGNIAIITLNSPPVNALAAPVRGAIVGGLQRAHEDPAVAAIVLICAGRTFIAGADISEFGKPPRSPSFEDMIVALENGPKPVIAAIHGTALGGGLETALLCHYRVAVPSAKLGLPEVNLGLLPGGGGTQRLPRIVGVEAALDLIVTGRSISAEEARDAGILDAVTEEGELRAGALSFARALVAENRPLLRIRDRDDMLAPARGQPEIFETYRRKNPDLFRGVKAPGYIIEAVKGALDLPFDEGIAKERALINELLAGRQFAALRYIFFAEREAAKVIGLPKDLSAPPINSVAILGAGAAVEAVEKIFKKSGLPVRHGLDGAADADLLIVASAEATDFAALAAIAKPQALFATHAVADLDRLASATGKAGQVIGLKFSKRLMEVCRRAGTSAETVSTAMQLGRKTGKVAVLCTGDFISDRMALVQSNVAELLKSEGVTAGEISFARYDYGFPGDEDQPNPGIAEARKQSILEALLFPLINTGAALLAEGAAQRASDIDTAMVTGFGWPSYTGGPMFWAATIGLPEVVAGLARLQSRFGDAFKPSPYLERLSNNGKNFQTEAANG
jgi:3-hydroxyacyl-CoA dehydrogenase